MTDDKKKQGAPPKADAPPAEAETGTVDPAKIAAALEAATERADRWEEHCGVATERAETAEKALARSGDDLAAEFERIATLQADLKDVDARFKGAKVLLQDSYADTAEALQRVREVEALLPDPRSEFADQKRGKFESRDPRGMRGKPNANPRGLREDVGEIPAGAEPEPVPEEPEQTTPRGMRGPVERG